MTASRVFTSAPSAPRFTSSSVALIMMWTPSGMVSILIAPEKSLAPDFAHGTIASVALVPLRSCVWTLSSPQPCGAGAPDDGLDDAAAPLLGGDCAGGVSPPQATSDVSASSAPRVREGRVMGG